MEVTLAQLVKASVGQTDVQRFEPHLGHNWLSCGVFLVKRVARSLYKRGVFTKSIPEEMRTITVPSLSGLYNSTLLYFGLGRGSHVSSTG